MPELQLTIVADGEDYAVAEYAGERGAALPAHVHAYEDEWLLVLDGELELWFDRDQLKLAPGEPKFLPRGVPHGATVASEHARFLVLLRPGARELIRALADPVPDPDDLAALLAGAGVTLL